MSLKTAFEIMLSKSASALQKLKESLQQQASHQLLSASRSSKKSDLQPGKQKELLKKKKALIHELELIDSEIRKCNDQRSQVKTKRSETEADQQVMYAKATQLISRMNKRRKEQIDKKNKERIDIHQSVLETLRKVEEHKKQEDQEKQRKKLDILKRIEERKLRNQVRDKYNKQANQLISELVSYRVSLPLISIQTNPQDKSQSSKKSIKHHYKVSPFLENVKREELMKKREEYLKEYQRKKVRERQQNYDHKIRGDHKHKKEGILFVTQ